MKSTELYKRLKQDFRPEECTDVVSVVGLQRDNCEEIGFVYTATFASAEVIDQLFTRDAHDCLLFTHHPSPQRKTPFDPPQALPKRYFDEMTRRGISLFSYHIPLDRNGPYAPGKNLAKHMGLSVYDEAFYFQDGVYMGVLCEAPYQTVTELAQALKKATEAPVKIYPYGENRLAGGRVAIMAGGASNPAVYAELEQKGINAFITGVTNPQIEWVAPIHEQAKTHRVSIIGGTHCATEKFALVEMVKYFEALGLPAAFIDETPRVLEL